MLLFIWLRPFFDFTSAFGRVFSTLTSASALKLRVPYGCARDSLALTTCGLVWPSLLSVGEGFGEAHSQLIAVGVDLLGVSVLATVLSDVSVTEWRGEVGFHFEAREIYGTL